MASSIAEQLDCPRCSRRIDDARRGLIVSSRRIVTCRFRHHGAREACGQQAWAMHLASGDVEPQLVDAFGAIGRDLWRAYALPFALDRAAFWSVSLSHAQARSCSSATIAAVLLELATRAGSGGGRR